MAKAVTIGNGNLLIGLDYHGQVRDFYFPYVGHSNHVSGASGSYQHRIGVWVDGDFAWISDDSWQVSIRAGDNAAMSSIVATNPSLGVTLQFTDVVHNEKDIFIRSVTVTNERDEARHIRLFFGQEFRISESRRGDTAFYDPRVGAVVHYKGHDAFLINAMVAGKQFSEYSIGIFGIEGKRGTYADAEDGELSKNPIEHGSVDSVIGVHLDIGAHDTQTVQYWIAAGKTIAETHALNAYVLTETPEQLVLSTENYWKAWTAKEERNFAPLEDDIAALYRKSLAIIRVHADNRGGVIASSDSDMLNQGRDAYSYVWPRDAAVNVHALDRAGYVDTTQRFFEFMASCLEPDGYVMHKYRVDGVLGSSWHPWVRDGKVELPIQEDETALVVYMLWKHYELAHDLEFLESMYNTCIEPAAEFMCRHVHADTGLPKSSYDLWEEKYGTSTYTAAAVCGALNAAAEISALLGKRVSAERYRNRAAQIREAILGYLYDPDMGAFVKLVRYESDKLEYDKTIDMSSLHGIVFFDILFPSDTRVQNTLDAVRKHLKVPTSFGGFMRYEEDGYYRTGSDAPPNAWIITTLWIAQCGIKAATSTDDLKEAHGILRWVIDRAGENGILPEQIHPHTGAHLSTAPLVWSHAEFVITVDEYLKKYHSFTH